MAMALRPFRSASRISSRKGAQTLADGARSGRGPVDPTGGSVDTPVVVAGFGGGHCPGPAAAAPHGDPGGPEVAPDRFPADARFRLDPSDRPAALAEGDDLLLFGGVNASQRGVPPAKPQLASRGGRSSGVHWWPDLGVHRGFKRMRRVMLTSGHSVGRPAAPEPCSGSWSPRR
jgi:hypothetical protein